MNRLKELRKNSGKTQKEIFEETGIPIRSIQNWENGKRQINLESAKQLADYFGVSIGYLLGHDVRITEVLEKGFEALDSLEESVKKAFEATNSLVEIRIQGIGELLKKLRSGIVNDEYDKKTILEILKSLEELTKDFESDISDMMEIQAKYTATQIYKNRLQNNIDRTIKKISK